MAYAGTIGRRRRSRRRPARPPGLDRALPRRRRASPERRSPTCCGRRRAPISPDAPSLPITIGGVAFNVPPAAIRFKVQRRPGAQARVDLTFVWPSLTPPDLTIKPLPTDKPEVTDRLFVTIATSDSTLAPAERLKAIYPRYADAAPIVGTDGLSLQGFREGSPYQGEDLILEPSAPERFLLRCTRQVALTPAHVPARAAHRRRRRHGALSARLAGRLAELWRTASTG